MNLASNQRVQLAFSGVLAMSPARPRSSSQVQKASRLLYIIPSHLDPSFLCTSCRLLVSVSVFLSVCWQYCVVTGYAGVALPPSISVRLSARLRLPPSLHFDTTGPDFLPTGLSFRPFPRPRLPPVGLMFFRCDRSRVNLQVSPSSVSAGSRSLPSSSRRCWKCKCVCRSSSGWSAATCEHSTCGDAVTSPLLFPSLLRCLGSDSSTVAKVWESENFVDPERPLGENLINGSLCRNIPGYFWQFSLDFSQNQNVFAFSGSLHWKTALIKQEGRRFFQLSDFDEESYSFFFFLHHDQ